MKRAGNDIATDACMAQGRSERGCEAHGMKIGVNPQGDPCCAEHDGQPSIDSLLLGQDEGESLGLCDRCRWRQGGDVAAMRNNAVGVDIAAEFRLHRAKENGEVGDRAVHDAQRRSLAASGGLPTRVGSSGWSCRSRSALGLFTQTPETFAVISRNLIELLSLEMRVSAPLSPTRFSKATSHLGGRNQLLAPNPPGSEHQASLIRAENTGTPGRVNASAVQFGADPASDGP